MKKIGKTLIKMKQELIVIFLVVLVSLTGLIIIFDNQPTISGQASFIESLLNWMKPLEQKIETEQNAGLYENENTEVEELNAKDVINQYRKETQDIEKNNQYSEELISQPLQTQNSQLLDLSVVGSWRAYSQAIFYDSGSSNWLNKPSTRRLTISPDGTWEYGSTGTWKTEQITENDWRKWNIQPYGPTKKIVLNGWSNSIGDGPIEEGSQGVDFIWIIYRSEKLSLGPATIQIKFGH
ncbi:hypothetical protein COV11_02330 [Candidatus Woesearchaeota archaeon CG10_big_fil_rev_8_21_14_0_10_30_7]|nr:MAG: hypothetical protein COV11_02330 [Candidatus Woesearchaeota archaeon CG10_big_fil_rev_8_21_14_0_10_30_7]